MKVDNSSLTGESEPQDRCTECQVETDSFGQKRSIPPIEANNLVFYTTMVNAGSGKGIVIGTADRTVMGQIAGLATETSAEATPIAKEIKKFITLISIIAITLGITFFVMGFAQETQIIKNIVFTIGIIVANVPEGLLATVTVSLALTAKRMHKKNVLVKNLEAVETLGSTTVIASDKTGTLTQNRMTVQHCWYDGQIRSCPAAKNRPHLEDCILKNSGDYTVYERNDETFKVLQKVASLCNNAKFITNDNIMKDMENANFDILGKECTSDASEAGIAKCMQLLRDLESFRSANPKLFEIKFNSTNKWALSIHKSDVDEQQKGPFLVLKGAPERVWKMCKTIMIDGKLVPLDKTWEDKFGYAYESLGGMGERVLGFAYKDMSSSSSNNKYTNDYKFESKPNLNFEYDDLTFVGLMSLIDPPREGVPEAVAKCKCAKIKVFMVTGDHPITALAIAKQVGIIDEQKWQTGKATIIKGDDIRSWMEMDEEMQREQWDAALSHEQIVWARVSPAHKLLIVENAQRRGEVVAVTGDGVNDAPALKKGDIGVAMGIAGKDVSKEAADMILMDDNFASIVNGVEEGRLIFDNLKKSIAYTLTSNIPEIAPFLLFSILNIPLALTTVLILCVDLGTDMIPAISLAYEKKESDIMDRPPRNAKTDRLVNTKLISFSYLQIGIMQALAGLLTYMIVLNDFGYTPKILSGTGITWSDSSLLCSLDSELRPIKCGYGCEEPKSHFNDALTLYGQAMDIDRAFCKNGCQVPFYGTTDPFSEFTDMGFRGFAAGEEAVCSRTCAWYNSLTYNEKMSYINARDNEDDPLRYILTEEDEELFNIMCSESRSDLYGFPGRGAVDSKSEAAEEAVYWWNGRPQLFPNKDYQENALAYAQSAYLITIVVVQWADLLIAKTRKLSIFDQGMRNNFMNFGLVFETVLVIILCYTPIFNTIFGTRPVFLSHWLTGIPWSIFIFIYDETRKSIIRQNPFGWFDTYTYW